LTDVAAYHVGKRFGRHKLLPCVSPNKTLEGAVGGVGGAVLMLSRMGNPICHFTGAECGWLAYLLCVIALSVAAQFGDLTMSALKRCYDIKDFNSGNGVIRYRCWDSCMYSDFTKMAHGNNRLTQKERFRQRFMHKLVYYPENNDGIFGCVGCGRCLMKCPISMNIVKVMKKIGGKESE